LGTDDGTVVLGQKAILASASPYFRAMFTSFEERNKDHLPSYKRIKLKHFASLDKLYLHW